jgi:hypothetical protein
LRTTDFVWERERFVISGVQDYLAAAFPPALPHTEHVVINSMAQKELARRLGCRRSIPNVLDFETPRRESTTTMLTKTGINWTTIFHPATDRWWRGRASSTPSSRRRLADPAKLVIPHPAETGSDYMSLLMDQDAGIDVRFVADRVSARALDARAQALHAVRSVSPL